MIHPGGMTDNSPTFQRWGRLNHLGRPLPNVETLGYCHVSLRDRFFLVVLPKMLFL